MASARASFAALARSRGRILERRYGLKLSIAAVLAFAALAAFIGQSYEGRLHPDAGLLDEAAAASFVLGLSFLGAAALRRALYKAPELDILHAQPLPTAAFIAWRGLECLAVNALGLGLLGVVVVAGAGPVSGAWIAALILALTLIGLAAAGLQFILAALAQRHLALALLAAAALVGLGAAGALAHPPLLEATPGGAALAWLRGESGAGLIVSLAWALGAPLLGLALAGWRYHERRAAARSRAPRSGDGASRAIKLAFRPWPQAARGLLIRDALLILRGGFPRAWVILALLWLAPAVTYGASRDATLAPWAVEAASTLVIVVLASALSFLTGADFPRHRRPIGVLEDAQPVPGGAAILSRLSLAVILGLPYLAGCVAVLALHPKADIAAVWPRALLKGGVMLVFLCHYGVVLGLRTERDRSGAEGAAFPIVVGMVGLVLSFAAAVSGLLLLAYPLLFGRSHRSGVLLYEAGERL